jgi:hypothetical protein
LATRGKNVSSLTRKRTGDGARAGGGDSVHAVGDRLPSRRAKLERRAAADGGEPNPSLAALSDDAAGDAIETLRTMLQSEAQSEADDAEGPAVS